MTKFLISEVMLKALHGIDVERKNVAGGIIFKNLKSTNAQVLIIKRAKDDHWPNFWEIPRGGVEDKEKIKQGLLREVKEETGLDVEILKYFNKFNYVTKENGIIKKISTQYNFICIPKNDELDPKVKLSFEHQDFKWISHDAEAELYLLNEIKQSVMMALNEYCNFVLNPSYDYEKNNIKIMESDFYKGTNF